MAAIQTTLGQLVDALPALVRLAERPLPSAQAYYLGRVIRAVRAETDAYDRQRQDLIRRHGKERPPTDAEKARGFKPPIIEILPTDAGWDAWTREIEALLKADVTLDRPAVDLSMVPGLEVAARDVLLLEGLVVFVQEPAPASGKKGKTRR